MKRLFLLTMVLLAAAGCSTDEPASPAVTGGSEAIEPPHFYGMAMLDNPAPETRGVANKLKIWPKTMAEKELTVKFLNGSQAFRRYVMDAAAEWEKAAGVRFFFVGDNQEAMIRVGFDYVPGMKTSWSYTGTDIANLFDKQNEPTIHFAQWPRVSDEKKRSDVLRAFGQTLGLELEFRHPKFYPEWKVDENGNVDEAYIRNYWEKELAGFISWEELKKMVLDPINVSARFIAQTDEYDPGSVMNWPFYDNIARNIPVTAFDVDYKTELSANDKEFIKSLYGESFNGMPIDESYLPLIKFDYTGTLIEFSVTTSKRLVVIWDKEDKDCSYIDMPTDTTHAYTATVGHTFADGKTRKIVIAEMLEYGQDMPLTSTALTRFDFGKAAGADSVQVLTRNSALEYVRITGDRAFRDQALDLSARKNLKGVFLVQTNSSTATVCNDPNLEVFATSPRVWKPLSVGPQLASLIEPAVNGFYEVDGPTIADPEQLPLDTWPVVPVYFHSLTGADISNCPKLRTISLENTRIMEIGLSGHPLLEYLYLSSFPEYIVGGGATKGEYLVNTLQNLPSRNKTTTGLIVVRAIGVKNGKTDEPLVEGGIPIAWVTIEYKPVQISRLNFVRINSILAAKNWQIVWDSGLKVSVN